MYIWTPSHKNTKERDSFAWDEKDRRQLCKIIRIVYGIFSNIVGKQRWDKVWLYDDIVVY